MNKVSEKLVARGVCDGRGVGFAANAECLPNGSYGMVLLCLNGNELDIYDTDMHTEPGRLMYRIPLAEAEVAVKGLLIKTLRIKTERFEYVFKNLMGLNPLLDIIKQESEK